MPAQEAYDIPTEFDPNLALGIVWGKDIADVRERGVSFLDNLALQGVSGAGVPLQSNVAFLKEKTNRILLF